MLSKDKKLEIYACVRKQFPDEGLYLASRVSEWLQTNGCSPADMGYGSFREFAKELPEIFGFQSDDNDLFICVKRWEEGEMIMTGTAQEHPADSFFGTNNVILNDDIIEMSQQSLYALTKILGNGLTVQEMKQQIYGAFSAAKENHTLSFLAEKYVFPIDYCRDGALVNGLVSKNLSPRGKSLYFAFEKTQIFRGGNSPEVEDYSAQRPSISPEVCDRIYALISGSFPAETPLHMAAVSKLLTDHGIDKANYGFFKMKELLGQMDFLELSDVVLGGVPQVMITLHRRPTDPAPVQKPAPEAEQGGHTLSAFCNLPQKPLAILQKYVEQTDGTLYDLNALREMLCEDYEAALAKDAVFTSEGKKSFPTRWKKSDGTPVEITLRPSAYEGRPWFLYFVDYTARDKSAHVTDPGRQLENFAFLGSWASFLSELAEKAVDEEWDFQNNPRRSYHVLIQYIKYTFCRLMRENKVCISDDRQFASFNTGLVDKHYDDIYACFIPNEEGSGTPWKFTGFCTAASRGLGKQVVNYFNPLPQPPRYFTRTEDLFFDLDKQLHTDFDHIIIDNINRLPRQFLYDQFYDTPEAREMISSLSQVRDRDGRREIYERLKEIVSDNSRLFIRIQNRIKESIELARKRVRWNYKTAIPSYFPKRDTMSLMLPLCLYDGEKPDVALVVERTQSGNYQGQTILTIPQAYIDARLMCRLSSDWLNPTQISLNSDGYDEQELSAADDDLAEID